MNKLQRSQRHILSLLGAALLLLVLSCNEASEGPVPPGGFTAKSWDEYTPLHAIYTGKFLVGNIISPSDIGGVRFNILKYHYNIITAENHMKPDQIAPNSDPGSVSAVWNYRFTTADAIINAAENENLKVHGHTLIWHSQSPSWLAAGGEDYLNKFVEGVVTHFKDRVISWDVVNEAFRDGLSASEVAGDWKDCLRKDAPWYTSIGGAYIEKAFLAARAADPAAELYYNDYNLNSNLGNYKQQAVYKMVKDINSRYSNVGGRPLIDGIGMQSHHHLNTTPESVEISINLFKSLGVKIGITELDIQAAGQGWGDWGDGNAQRQAAKYAAFFKIFINNASHITRVTFWGLDDRTSWRSSSYPTLLDKDYKSKPAFEAVMYPSRY